MNLGVDKQSLGFVKYYALVFSVLGITFYLGYVTASWYKGGLQKEVKVMQQSNENLASENQSLNSRINAMQIALDVANLASQQNQNAMQEALARESTLKEQIGFYQRVMAPELTQDGFVVERIEVLPTPSNENYSVSMILLQHENIKATIKGDLMIKLSGSLNGSPASFDLSELQDEPKTPLNYGFRYFQVISTSITLPENFQPQAFEIVTDVYKYNRRRGRYTSVISWDEAFNQIQ
ncbi:DUF6776 family protein [Glaciecola sp. SC05]|uniref:DUF6776 family protein n=1 Tax=Glaciecola sp. SC05 TaxID=1987355 RepID=UPI003526F0EE